MYLKEKGVDTIARHAADFIRKRLAPAVIPNDGKQTPMRGHPVFIAQHATGCCCRGCFENGIVYRPVVKNTVVVYFSFIFLSVSI